MFRSQRERPLSWVYLSLRAFSLHDGPLQRQQRPSQARKPTTTRDPVTCYFIFDTDTAAAWYYKNELDGCGRSRQIGLNLLLVPDLDMLFSRYDQDRIRHFAFIFDLWGYQNAALYLAESAGDVQLVREFQKIAKRWPPRLRKIQRVYSRVRNRNIHRLT